MGRRNLRFITDLIKKYGGIKRLGCMFETPNRKYLYDSGTGKVIELNEDEGRFFSWLFNREDSDGYNEWSIYNNDYANDDMILGIKEVIMEENLLQSPYPSKMISPMHQEELEQGLKENVRLITLELTGRCNLRCGYCIYNEEYEENRNFSEDDMSEETAIKAIKYLADNSGNDVAVTFYGGEPLLKYELIQKSVVYAQELMSDKNLIFSMTSNLTLMTREMAEYFYGIEQFFIVASIDGPEEIHDEYRKYSNGKGSFKDAIRGLEILTEVFGDQFVERVSLSMVYTPPYTFEKIDRINKFFEDSDWLPIETDKNLSYPERGSLEFNLEEADGVTLDDITNRGYVYALQKWAEKYYHDGEQNKRGLITKKFQEEILLKVHKRALTNKPTELYGLNGSCVPGTRRLYITTNGEFKVCERMGVSPSVGNVDQGLIYNVIKKNFVDDYISESQQACSECWAKRICGVCYAKSYSTEKIDMEKKNFQCDMARHGAKEGLILYHKCLEEDAESMKFLNNIIYG